MKNRPDTLLIVVIGVIVFCALFIGSLWLRSNMAGGDGKANPELTPTQATVTPRTDPSVEATNRMKKILERLDSLSLENSGPFFSQFVPASLSLKGYGVIPTPSLSQAQVSLQEAQKKYDDLLKKPEPTMPEKPEYSKPQYAGAYYLSGTYRGPFTGGGIVLERGGKYYLIEDAQEVRNPFATTINGYVEDTGREITVDYGRNGRLCKVVRISSKETYADDQQEYRDNVKESKVSFSNEMKQYQENLKQYKLNVSEYSKLPAELESAKGDLVAKLEMFVTELKKPNSLGF